MEIDDLRLIAGLSAKYADGLCEHKDNETFDRGSIIAAYIIGAYETLHRVMNVIRESVQPHGLTDVQARRIIEIITIIEKSELQ